MLDIIKVFGEEKIAALIRYTDQNTTETFEFLLKAIEAGRLSNIVHFPLEPEQQAIWGVFNEIEAAPTYASNNAAFEAAAELIINAWIDYPRPGTEQPYIPGPLNGNRRRREVCNGLSWYAEDVCMKIEDTGQMIQNYTIATLFDKLAW